jgi:ABC-type oligopeptide transport system substrate-binding subunit
VRIWLSLAALAAGAALLAASALARPGAPSGGTLRVLLDNGLDFVDPALAYYVPSRQIEYATCSMLVNYPDAVRQESVKLVPDGAAAMPTISRNGLVYTFRVRNGRRFSDGSAITARNFEYAINRSLNQRMGSPAQPFFEAIVGAKAVVDGARDKASGIRVLSGNRLQIRLTKRAPDMLARLAMPFACAIKTNMPNNPDGVGAPVVGSGPYYIQSWEPRRSIELRRNRFYRGPRPHNVDRVVYRIGGSPSASFDAIERGDADWYSFPSSTVDERFATSPLRRINPSLAVRYLAFNVSPGRAFSNTRLRQAVALALDRTELAAAYGPGRATPTDKFVPPAMPGHRPDRVYSLSATPEALAEARALAAPYVPVTVFDGGLGVAAGAVATQLGRIGIEVRAWPRSFWCNWWCPRDLAVLVESSAYADPAAILRPVLEYGLSEGRSKPFPDKRWLRRIAAADRLEGRARLAALGRLDVELVRTAVPGVPFALINSRELFSARVGCSRFHGVYHVDLAALCLR